MRLELNTEWLLREEPLSCGLEQAHRITAIQEGWLETAIPSDVHMPLIEAGIIPEPLTADHCFQSEWIEQRSWWYTKSFDVSIEPSAFDRITLNMESLDAEADIWLNGVHLGHQRSAFYPFHHDVRSVLKTGNNVMLVRVTSGLEHVSDNDVARIADSVNIIRDDCMGSRGDARRLLVRKPQFVYGWDWGPRVATCGIVGRVWLDMEEKLLIRHVKATTLSIENSCKIRFEMEIDQFHPFATSEADVNLSIEYQGTTVAHSVTREYLRSGLNYFTLDMEIPDAHLWWPNGMGEQPLYTVKVSAESGLAAAEYPPFEMGIRTLRLNTDQSADGGRLFRFEVNGEPVFCKGGNWIPADSIYARVSEEIYETLVREAKEANFNMLRIWGGGTYERNAFYEACDRMGIFIWHDFMFACAKYPDDMEWFRQETEREIDYQTRRLSNHCSIALWCGNNENHWGFDEWWRDTQHPDFYGGAAIYNEIAPRIVNRNCPEIPYWNSSPYGGSAPNDSAEGDRHHWFDCMMNPDMDKRITPEEYDKVNAKFVSEYGYVGPTRHSSIVRYHGTNEPDKNGNIWALHNNTFEQKTVPAGIRKHYMDPDTLTSDEYLHYAGLVQGLMLGYSLESFRTKPECSGGLFWMYNDCWGEVGWTIIDYYLTRKLSYYYVKRAFAPVKLIMREDNGRVIVWGVNETAETVETSVEYGFFPFDGDALRSTHRSLIRLEPRSRCIVMEFDKGDGNATEGIHAVLPEDHDIVLKAAYLRELTFREMSRPDRVEVKIKHVETRREDLLVTVESLAYAHAVHFGLDDQIRMSDEFFDLLPGEARTVVIYRGSALLNAGELRCFAH